MYRTFLIATFSSVLISSAAAQQFACDGRFLISLHTQQDDASTEGTSLFRVDFGQDHVGFIDKVVFPDIKINGIGYNWQDRQIYGIDQSFRADRTHPIVRFYADGTHQVLKMDKNLTEEITWDYAAADCSPEGHFVVHDRETQQLHYLNVLGDQVTLHASVPLRWATGEGTGDFYVAMDDFVFDADGSIYSYQRNYDKDEEESAQTKGALLKINGDLGSPEVGTVSVVGQVNPKVTVHMGAMFLTGTGELYAYGSVTPYRPAPPGLQHNRLIAIDKQSGAAQLVKEGPEAKSNDGCSCPFSLGMSLQTVLESDQCQNNLRYEVMIENTSLERIPNVTFSDTLPSGMVISDISLSSESASGVSLLGEGAYQVAENTGVGFGVLTLENVSLESNTSISLTINVSTRGLSGEFQHQAYLTNLPAFLGGELVSDDTTTAVPYDPTAVTIRQTTPPKYLAEDTTVCEGGSVVLSAGANPADFYYWSSRAGFYLENADASVTLPTGSDSAYYYLHQRYADCEVVDSILIRKEALALEILSDTTITLGATVELAPYATENPAAIYQWSPAEALSCADCANPQVSPERTTTYRVTVRTPSGCTQVEDVLIMIDPETTNEKVHLPNAFSPNDDGLNDTFFPVTASDVTVQTLEVYNRWGELIFKQDDFGTAAGGWDGTYRGRAVSTGTYWYRLVATPENGEKKEIRGKLNLLR